MGRELIENHVFELSLERQDVLDVIWVASLGALDPVQELQSGGKDDMAQ